MQPVQERKPSRHNILWPLLMRMILSQSAVSSSVVPHDTSGKERMMGCGPSVIITILQLLLVIKVESRPQHPVSHRKKRTRSFRLGHFPLFGRLPPRARSPGGGGGNGGGGDATVAISQWGRGRGPRDVRGELGAAATAMAGGGRRRQLRVTAAAGRRRRRQWCGW